MFMLKKIEIYFNTDLKKITEQKITFFLAELGRFSLFIKTLTLAVKQWLRLEGGTQNTVLNEAYKDSKVNHHWWYTGITAILNKYGFRENLYRPVNKTFPLLFNQRMKDWYIQSWHNDIDYLQFLRAVKENNYKCSPYLHNITNCNIRNKFSQFRIPLPGKYNNICNLCQVKEDIYHLFIVCPKYSQVSLNNGSIFNEIPYLTNG